MSASPVTLAREALYQALDLGLVAAGYLPLEGLLERDPENAFEPSGEADRLQTAAAVFHQTTVVRRVLAGGARARYDLDLAFDVELAVVGGSAAERAAALAKAQAALAALTPDGVTPVLGGAARWLRLAEPRFGDLAPNGRTLVVSLTLDVSAGDELGATPLL